MLKEGNDLNKQIVDQQNEIFSLKKQIALMKEKVEIKLLMEINNESQIRKFCNDSENIEEDNELNKLKKEMNKKCEEKENLLLNIQELLKEKSEIEKNLLRQNEENLKLYSIISNNKVELENLHKENKKINDMNISILKNANSRSENEIRMLLEEKIKKQKNTIHQLKVFLIS